MDLDSVNVWAIHVMHQTSSYDTHTPTPPTPPTPFLQYVYAHAISGHLQSERRQQLLKIGRDLSLMIELGTYVFNALEHVCLCIERLINVV